MLVPLVLLAQATATAPAQATPVAAAPPAAASTADPSAPTAEGLEELRRSFHDSCEVRVYGEYDDLCSGLADEIRRYRSALQRATRHPSSR